MTASGFFVEAVVLGHEKFKVAGPAAAWLWVQCGVWSASADRDGFVTAIAVKAYGTLAQARRLVEVGLWEEADDGFRFLRWRNGHPTPETSSEEQRRKAAERSRRYREKQAASRKTSRSSRSERDASRDASRDGDVTRHVRHAEVDSSSSLEVPPLSPPQGTTPPAVAPKPKRSTRPSTPLPTGWEPSQANVEYADLHRLDVGLEAEKFRNHHAMKGTLGKDWNAGFRNWLVNSVQFRDERAARTPAPAAPPAERPLKRF